MIKDNLLYVNEAIQNIKIKNHIEYPISLLAVSKTYPATSVSEAMDAGQVLFGENRVLEAYSKFNDGLIKDRKFDLHIIGHLQRNKVKEAIAIANMIQSIDKIETLIEVEKYCQKINKHIDFLIEVNTSGESQKAGINPESINSFLETIQNQSFTFCKLKGLMTVGPLTDNKNEIRRSFRSLKELFDYCKTQLDNPDFDIVSMGMSNDFELAIAEGSNLLRIGSAIFGRRE